MNVDILGLEAFLAIAEQGRFHKAARQLHITQTALTRRLQNIEDQLGVKLVERTTRSVALTPLGASFLPQARRLVAELEAALVEIRETGLAQRGNVVIACVPTVGVRHLPEIIREYAGRLRPELMAHDIQKMEQAGMEKIRFGWAGSIEVGGGHYYRVQGPTFLIEYDNVQNNNNHIHAVWRDSANDFGEDILKKHYAMHSHLQ